ncbi:MAG: hypothetical protein JWN70_1193 [Planctomycetaceae bacterium]|nr:hypothetical protein [Planctomycetaceae bacterium]
MIRHNLIYIRSLGIMLMVQAAALAFLPGTAAAQEEDPPAASDSPDNGGRSRGDRGDRGGRGGDRGGRGRRDESGAGNQPANNPQPGKPGTKPKVRVGRVGPKSPIPTATLPAQYVARDTNRDGQIGLYEWSRTDISTFNRLDTNRDGFLVPSELANPGSGGAAPAVASTSTATPAATGTGSVATTAISAAAKPAAAAAPSVDPKVAAAESAFDFLDKEDASGKKDGILSAEEWERSRGARKLFTDAKVEVQIPLTKAKFVENYVKLSK